jgi:hypothetical protein
MSSTACERLSTSDARYLRWKSNTPLTHDAMISSFLEWGSLSLAWGAAQPLSKAAETHLAALANPSKARAVEEALGRDGMQELELAMRGMYGQRVLYAPRSGTDGSLRGEVGARVGTAVGGGAHLWGARRARAQMRRSTSRSCSGAASRRC